MLFTANTKQHLATVAKQRFEDKKVRIPMGDEYVRRDLHSLQKLTTAVGGVRFDANRDEGGHADRAWRVSYPVMLEKTHINRCIMSVWVRRVLLVEGNVRSSILFFNKKKKEKTQQNHLLTEYMSSTIENVSWRREIVARTKPQ